MYILTNTHSDTYISLTQTVHIVDKHMFTLTTQLAEEAAVLEGPGPVGCTGDLTVHGAVVHSIHTGRQSGGGIVCRQKWGDL